MQRSLANAGAGVQEALEARAERGKRGGAADQARGQTPRASSPKGGVQILFGVRWEAPGEF